MAQPIKIMMIRHGEKPTAKHQPPYGVTDAGEEDKESLTVRGWQRAGALATLFDSADGRQRRPYLATPTVIFASKPREAGDAKDDDGSKSKRPLQTITPLAARLGLSPRLSFAAGDEEALASEVRQSSGVVLISWQHEKLNKIAHHLLEQSSVDGVIPDTWPDDRFDVVWVFDPPSAAGGRWRFDQVPQNLLHGDRSTVIA